MSDQIRCPHCGNVLGECTAGVYIIRHRKRTIVCAEIVSIECDQCHAVYRPGRSPLAA